MKKIAAIFLCCVFLIICTSCTNKSNVVEYDNEIEQNATPLSENTTGSIGEIYKSQWFMFSVDSIERLDAYDGIEESPNIDIIDVTISISNSTDTPVLASCWNFYIDAPTFIDYVWPVEPFGKTLMPEELTVKAKETINYHIVFQVPKGAMNMSLFFSDIDESGNEVAVLTIPWE